MKETLSAKKHTKTQIKMTHQEYDELVNSIVEMGYIDRTWYPEEKDVLELAEDPVGQLEFTLWILYSDPERKLTEEQKTVEKSLKDLVENTIIFV
ncbi:hypothetical protein SAMN05216349_12333 [Oribacterium sp. KHPX15]|uniref:hypothetical protein n=1 Tax=Oribacterium sp. KHPX15 TaxID=1855342 RepID=UPI0008943AAE|nr:hypothetical protein [Oribacterium sp. KHPX15]SEA69695.1 hypothetical protein SAMN05216349_12333 [Oribacterium sp. KHPX15]